MNVHVRLLSVCLQTHREQDSHSKHLQVISGAPIFLYWLANAIWDGLAYGLSASAILGLIAAYHQQGFSGERLWAAAALLAGFGPAGLSMTYLLHFMFTVSGSCVGHCLYCIAMNLQSSPKKLTPVPKPTQNLQYQSCLPILNFLQSLSPH